ncbi:DUF6258 family protein [Kiloniella majae]|uniref:DUF6258 family protein n=1 Tax=Kiloniella majae TaxID=1938558 RepID=UPI000F77BBE4|nr:DUF6258 family protein [Kiloniella majae]
MMNLAEFTNSLYLGDRACKKIIYDTWKEELCIQVDNISRIRSKSGNWDYYTEEDIEDGFIVFTGIKKVIFDSSGKAPNDQVNYLKIENQTEECCSFVMSIDHVDSQESDENTETILKITAENICLRNPLIPDIDIID